MNRLTITIASITLSFASSEVAYAIDNAPCNVGAVCHSTKPVLGCQDPANFDRFSVNKNGIAAAIASRECVVVKPEGNTVVIASKYDQIVEFEVMWSYGHFTKYITVDPDDSDFRNPEKR